MKVYTIYATKIYSTKIVNGPRFLTSDEIQVRKYVKYRNLIGHTHH